MNNCNSPEMLAGTDDVFWVERGADPADTNADEPTYSIGAWSHTKKRYFFGSVLIFQRYD